MTEKIPVIPLLQLDINDLASSAEVMQQKAKKWTSSIHRCNLSRNAELFNKNMPLSMACPFHHYMKYREGLQ